MSVVILSSPPQSVRTDYAVVSGIIEVLLIPNLSLNY